jgi:hypothetical protein
MSLTAVTVVYGGDTNFTQEMPASDGKQDWVNTDFITGMKQNTGTLNTGGAIFRYANPAAPYETEYRVVETPTAIAPSDLG